MHFLRRALVFFGIGLCSGCSPPVSPSCSTPRTGNEASCEVVDAGSWRFIEGEPLPAFETYCEATCIDFSGEFSISGEVDLRKVPLLPKIRRLASLSIDVDGLKDLSGLEHVDVGRLTLLSSSKGQDQTFRSFSGLTDEEVEAFSIENVSISSLSGLPLKRIASLSLTRTGLVEVDLSGVENQHTSLETNSSLRTLRLPPGRLKSVMVSTNPALTELTWDAGLEIDSLFFYGNTSLSTCAVDRLALESKPDGGTQRVTNRDNGACP